MKKNDCLLKVFFGKTRNTSYSPAIYLHLIPYYDMTLSSTVGRMIAAELGISLTLKTTNSRSNLGQNWENVRQRTWEALNQGMVL